MKNDGIRLFRALMNAEKKQTFEVSLRKGCAVALSRDYGCGGEEIAQLLAKKLGVHCFDKDLLDAVVHEANLDGEMMQRLDECVSGRMEAWMYALIFGEASSPDDYWRNLSRVMLRIAEHGGVFVGRGSHFILAKQSAFRVRITGSPRVCARRLAEKENIPLEEARQRVKTINEERAACFEEHFKRPINDVSAFDLIINTDRLDVQAAVHIILEAMQHAGHKVPERKEALA